MQKWMWVLAIGAVVTYFAYKWNKLGGYVAGIATILGAWYFYGKS
jgi:hypothetical protein